MNLRPRLLAASLVALALAAIHAEDALACGGCFPTPSETESTVVTGHRMAVSISPDQTVLWDQIKYSGSPSAFAWVLPVRSGAVIELSTDAWFETLDAATSVKIVSPSIICPSSGGGAGCGLVCGGGASAEGNYDNRQGGNTPPVTVVHEGTVGPYETVTLHANVPGALPDWLTTHGFAIDKTVQPVIDAYVNEGFDFIALRLLPGQGVQQMKPVRVVTPGSAPSLPLRMVAAGTGANVGITLFVIGEGRWKTQNFPMTTVDTTLLTWDFAADRSNYADVRQVALAANGGLAWLTTYAKKGALLSPEYNPTTGQSDVYQIDSLSAGTIADAYAAESVQNKEGDATACSNNFVTAADSTAKVSGACLTQQSGPSGSGGAGGAGGAAAGGGGTGGAGTGGAGTGGGANACTVPAGEIDARDFACGAADDVARALVGLHPADVWVTRLEANLPHIALSNDLVLAAAEQKEVENWIALTKFTNSPCDGASLASVATAFRPPPEDVARRNRLAMAGAVLGLVAAALGRRRRRPAAMRPQAVTR
jgi:hypothetical protein